MKKNGLVYVVLLMGILISACQPQVVTETLVETQIVEVEKEGALTIGYAAPGLMGGQASIQSGLVDNAKVKGWAVVTTNANGDPQKQLNDVEYMVSLPVDAVVAVPKDSAGICTAVEKAQAAGIPFYTIDIGPVGCQVDMVVMSNNTMAGEQAGQALVDLLTEKYGEPQGKVLEITGDLAMNTAVLRRDGFHNVLDQYPNIEVIQKAGNWQADLGASIVEDVAGANEDLDAIYMASDAVYFPGTIAALDQLGRLFPRGEEGHIFLAGVDASPSGVQAIKDGWADACSSQPIPDFGIVVEWIEMKVLNGEDPSEGEVVQEGALWSPAEIIFNAEGTPELFLATTLVTEENMNDPALWANQQ